MSSRFTKEGSCPERAAKIAALLLREAGSEHYDLVSLLKPLTRKKRPTAPTEFPVNELTPAVGPFRKCSPKAKYTGDKVKRPRRPRPSDEQARILREAIEATGITVSRFVHLNFPKRYDTVYALHPEPTMRKALVPWILNSIIQMFNLDPKPFDNLLVDGHLPGSHPRGGGW